MKHIMDLIPTNKQPFESNKEVREIQLQLDSYAQELFGPRNPNKKLLWPTFTSEGPQVRNTAAMDGGHAELSLSAAGSWPLTIFQLAHETIHLLDPRAIPPKGKGANWLEEGIATQFSLMITRSCNHNITISDKKYKIANNLFLRLGKDHLKIASSIRESAGHFSDTTPEAISMQAPHISFDLACKLATSFYK